MSPDLPWDQPPPCPHSQVPSCRGWAKDGQKGDGHEKQLPPGLSPSRRQQGQGWNGRCCWTTSTGAFGFRPALCAQTQLHRAAWDHIVAPTAIGAGDPLGCQSCQCGSYLPPPSTSRSASPFMKKLFLPVHLNTCVGEQLAGTMGWAQCLHPCHHPARDSWGLLSKGSSAHPCCVLLLQRETRLSLWAPSGAGLYSQRAAATH